MSNMFVSLDDVGVKVFDSNPTGDREEWKNIKAEPLKSGGTAAFRFMEEYDSPLFLKRVPLHTFLAGVGSMYCIHDAAHRAKGEHCPWCQEVVLGLNDKLAALEEVSGMRAADFKNIRAFTEDCQKQTGIGAKSFFKLKPAAVETDAKILGVPEEKIPLLKVLVDIKDLENLKAKSFNFVPVFDHRVRDFRILEITSGLMGILSNSFIALQQKLTDSDIIVKKNSFGPNWWGVVKQSAEPLHADVLGRYGENKPKYSEYYKRFLSVREYDRVQESYQKYLTKKNEAGVPPAVSASKPQAAPVAPTPVAAVPSPTPAVAVAPASVPTPAASEPSEDSWNF